MKVLVSYCASKEALVTLAHTLHIQRKLNAHYDSFDHILVSDVNDIDIPFDGVVKKAPLWNEGELCVSKGRNIAFDYATQKGYDCLVVLDSDGVILGNQDRPPHQWSTLPIYHGKPGETSPPTHYNPEYVGYLALSYEAFSQCRYYEWFKGWSAEDNDLRLNVLYYKGIAEERIPGFSTMHIWHPERNRWKNTKVTSRNEAMWLRRAAYFHLKTGKSPLLQPLTSRHRVILENYINDPATLHDYCWEL